MTSNNTFTGSSTGFSTGFSTTGFTDERTATNIARAKRQRNPDEETNTIRQESRTAVMNSMHIPANSMWWRLADAASIIIRKTFAPQNSFIIMFTDTGDATQRPMLWEYSIPFLMPATFAIPTCATVFAEIIPSSEAIHPGEAIPMNSVEYLPDLAFDHLDIHVYMNQAVPRRPLLPRSVSVLLD